MGVIRSRRLKSINGEVVEVGEYGGHFGGLSEWLFVFVLGESG